jgi:hypothetical protein
MIAKAASVPLYLAWRVACALVLFKLAASRLDSAGFNLFMQFGLYCALVNFVCAGALQNGLVRAVAAVREDCLKLGKIHAAAASFSGGLCAGAVLATVLASPALSFVLAGDGLHAGAVLMLTTICALGAPGQLWCGLLTGRGHVLASLSCQGVGLMLGAIASAARLLAGDAVGASLCLASGPVATTVLAGLRLRPWRWPGAFARPLRKDLAVLAQFTLAVGGSYAFSSATLFALRFVYREEQGAVALSHWLAASRISDMSTQLVGLLMAQVILPELAAARDGAAKRVALLHGAIFGGVASALALVTFAVGAKPLVSAFLSPAYLAAIPAIVLYLAGDVPRAGVSLAQQVNLAGGGLRRYVTLEIGLPAVMAAAMAALLAGGVTHAPELAYFIANCVIAGVALVAMARRARPYALARRSAETV